jgi:hypothetical protein
MVRDVWEPVLFIVIALVVGASGGYILCNMEPTTLTWTETWECVEWEEIHRGWTCGSDCTVCTPIRKNETREHCCRCQEEIERICLKEYKVRIYDRND